MKTVTDTALVVLGVLILSVLPGGAVELKLKWQPGKRYVVENTSDSFAKMPLPGQGMIETKGRLALRVHNDVSAHEKGVKVGYSYASVKMRQEMQGLVMEYDSSDPSKGGGLLGPVLQPLTEIRFAAIYDKEGQLVETEGLDEVQGADQLGMGKEELEAMARQSSQFLPGREVKPGDSWKTEVDLPMGGIGGKVTIDYTLKLEGIVEQEGREVARISISGRTKEGDAKEGEEVLKTEVKEATGTMLFDIGLGQPLEVATTILLETGLPAGIPQAEGAPGKMPLKTVSVAKLIGVEDLKEAASGSKGESKAKAESTAPAPAENKEEKRARRKARKAKRKAEKAQPE
jgi:hypothetical protein